MRASCTVFACLMFFASAAGADTCEEQVTAFAEASGLQASAPAVENMGATEPTPPATLESRGLGAEPLVRSGGVREPVDDTVKQAAGIPSSRDVGSGETGTGAPPERMPPVSASRPGSEKRLRAENFLLGARSAALAGREQECLTLLQEAKEAL